MSILNYFTRTDKETSSNVVIPTGGVPGIYANECGLTRAVGKYKGKFALFWYCHLKG